MASDPRLDALRALAQQALRLAAGTPSARLALGTLHGLIDVRIAPEAWRDELDSILRSANAESVVPLAAKDAERVLKDAWGAKPASEVDDLDLHAPVALTPSSAVFRAERDGRPVAVKVQRPGLSETLRGDMTLLDTLARPLGAALPRLDPAALVREARERLLDELDLEHEAQVLRTLNRALRRHPLLGVPAPHTDLCHEHVLVCDWIDGRDATELATEEERIAVARALVAFHVGLARVGTLHADPRPDHVLLDADGRAWFVDPGASAIVDASRADLAVAALDALQADDGAAFGAALEGLGAFPAAEGPRVLELARDALGPFTAPGPHLLDAAAMHDVLERASLRGRDAVGLLGVGSLPAQELWPARMLGSLFATLGHLEVELDWAAELRAAAADGPGALTA